MDMQFKTCGGIKFPLDVRFKLNNEITGQMHNKKGEITFNEVKYSSPSTAAVAAAVLGGHSVDSHSGWSQWEYNDETDKTWKPIGLLKVKFSKKK